MNKKQKREIDSLVRVRAFLEEHPTPGSSTYGNAPAVVDEVLAQVDEHAGDQALGHQLCRAEQRRQDAQIALIYETFMRPIATIARMQIEPGSDAGLPAGLRLPRLPLAPNRVLAACHAMIEAARPFEALLVSKGLPADFLTRFEAARDALASMRGNIETQLGRRVAAGSRLETQLRRGRRAVTELDAIVRSGFRGNVSALTAWGAAKRVYDAPSFSSRGVVPTPTSESITEAAA